MSRWRATIAQRRPVFVGCEGKSEAGYAGLIGRLASERESPRIHIVPVQLNPGAGDPVQLIERAASKIKEIERKRDRFWRKAVLIDVASRDVMQSVERRAREYGIQFVVWQSPDHEALLLRHFRGCENRRPPNGLSMSALKKQWPSYEKGMTISQLADYIGVDDIRRACTVEPELYRFLDAIGFN
jgi:hypothetical protein